MIEFSNENAHLLRLPAHRQCEFNHRTFKLDDLRTTIEIKVIQIDGYEDSPDVYQTAIDRLLIIKICHLVMDAKQTTLNNFLQLSSDSEPDKESEYTPSPKKSVLKIPDQWT